MQTKSVTINIMLSLSFLVGLPSLSYKSPAEFNNLLGNGINLGNALDAPKEGDWGVTLQPEYFTLIKAGGFSHVRVPIRWSTHALDTAPYTIEPAFLERVDWAVQNASGQSLPVILNMHHYEELEKSPDQHKARFIAMWKQIAQHFKNAPDSVAFEIYNEPSAAMDAERWNSMLQEALKEIRAVNPDRIVIIGPTQWNGISALPSLTLPANDQNLIVTVHYYDPFHFTHQGASWAGAESKSWLGTKWTDSKEERSKIEQDFDKAYAWGTANRRPVYLGEFGAYEQADMDSRALWTKAVREEANRRKFSTAYWEFCSGFGVYDPAQKKWREPILKALTNK